MFSLTIQQIMITWVKASIYYILESTKGTIAQSSSLSRTALVKLGDYFVLGDGKNYSW